LRVKFILCPKEEVHERTRGTWGIGQVSHFTERRQSCGRYWERKRGNGGSHEFSQ